MNRRNYSLILVPLFLCNVCGFAAPEKKPEPIKDAPPSVANMWNRAGQSYAITERGANQRVWAKVSWETNAVGRVKAITNSYTELATGMHFKNERGEWAESKEEIEILPNDAGAIARKGQHKAIFPPEIKSGLIELQMPEGQWMRSRVWGLAYFDASTGESVLLAEVKESEGQLVGDNVLVYPNAFTDFVADVRYTYMRAGFEQDVVLREQPPGPDEFGLNPKTTRLQVLTEFVESPQPHKNKRRAGALADEALAFGKMTIGQGKAFAVDGQGKSSKRLPVAKQWGQLEGRDFLVEEVPYEKVVEQLQKLPQAGKYEGASLQRRGKGDSVLAGLKQLMPKRYAKTTPEPSSKPKRMAKAELDQSPAFVMDYITVTTQTDYTFRGDTTYYISGAVDFSGTVVLEGGTVIKYALFSSTYPAPTIGVGTLICKTDSYRPAIFTAKDDNSIGQTISDSTGTPSLVETYGDRYLWIDSQIVKNVRMSYAEVGIGGSGNWTVQNAQFSHCYLNISGIGNATLRNVLIHNSEVGLQIEDGGFAIENMTAHQVNYFLEDSLGAGIYANLTNCLLVAVTNWNEPFTSINNATNSNGSAVFQTVGGGAHYLTTNSPYRNIGTTNIDTKLLASLKKKTTYPPLVFSNTISANTTLFPWVQRDVDMPDLGYHYDPIDYWSWCAVTNATLTLTNGVVLGYYRNSGVHLDNGGRLESYGSPLTRNYLTYFGLVQEQSVILDPIGVSQAMAINPYHANTAAHPEVLLNFTTLSAPQGANYVFYEAQDNWDYQRIELRNCEIYGGGSTFNLSYAGPANASFKFLNNLFEHTCLLADTAAPASATLIARNNLFRSTIGGVEIADWDSNGWQITDNVFDGIEFYIDGSIGYNAYVNGAYAYSTIQTNDIIATNFTWVAGPLGNYYQFSTNLINRGSQTAAAGGLYHYTVITNISGGLQIKETNSVVDIGYHYVAVNGSGAPVDSDADGIPDCMEDSNGDGVYGAGDIADWTDDDTDNDGVNDGDEVAAGTNPFDAWSVKKRLGLWQFNGTNWMGNNGQLPLINEGTSGALVSGVETNGVDMGGPSGAKRLAYRCVETNGQANLWFTNGTIRFWFKPQWKSVSLGGGGPTGSRLLNIGQYATTNGLWSLLFVGDQILIAADDGNGHTAGSLWGSIAMTSNRWYQVTCSYTPTNVGIYINGQSVCNGGGLNGVVPPPATLAQGFFLGTDTGGGQQSGGSFDYLETFTYPKSATEITNEYVAIAYGSGDADNDGVSGADELAAGTNPFDPWSVKKRLGLWQFNGTDWIGANGQLPLVNEGTGSALVAGVESNAVDMGGPSYTKRLAYRVTEADGKANLWLTNGTIRFWFKPQWQSVSLGGGGGGGRLFELGQYGTTNGLWSLLMINDQLFMGADDGNGHGGGSLWGSIAMTSNRWYQVTCSYTPTNVGIYINGQSVCNGGGLNGVVPPPATLAQGFFLGTEQSGGTRINGSFDYLETFTYPKSATEVTNEYSSFINADSDNDGVIAQEDADSNNPFVGRSTITIQTPANGTIAN